MRGRVSVAQFVIGDNIQTLLEGFLELVEGGHGDNQAAIPAEFASSDSVAGRKTRNRFLSMAFM